MPPEKLLLAKYTLAPTFSIAITSAPWKNIFTAIKIGESSHTKYTVNQNIFENAGTCDFFIFIDLHRLFQCITEGIRNTRKAVNIAIKMGILWKYMMLRGE